MTKMTRRKKLEKEFRNLSIEQGVKFHEKTGSRPYISHVHTLKEAHKAEELTAIDLFKECHNGKKTGLSEPVKKAINQGNKEIWFWYHWMDISMLYREMLENEVMLLMAQSMPSLSRNQVRQGLTWKVLWKKRYQKVENQRVMMLLLLKFSLKNVPPAHSFKMLASSQPPRRNSTGLHLLWVIMYMTSVQA